jgi:hypothetical protein
VGADFDPERFDLEGINRDLARPARRRPARRSRKES